MKNRNTPFNLHTHTSQRLPRAAYTRCKRIISGNRGRVLICCELAVRACEKAHMSGCSMSRSQR
jgi:hypothetical protein